jgi:hypothetical protein
VAGCCQYGNELSVSIKGEEFLDQNGDCRLLKMGSSTRGSLGGSLFDGFCEVRCVL